MNTKFVTSLELSKKLKELGVPQESEFWWADAFEDDEIRLINSDFKVVFDRHPDEDNIFFSSFLSDELLEWLPDYFNKDNFGTYHFSIERVNNNFVVAYRYIPEIQNEKSKIVPMQHNFWEEADTLPEALGLMLEYLIINKIIKAYDLRKDKGNE